MYIFILVYTLWILKYEMFWLRGFDNMEYKINSESMVIKIWIIGRIESELKNK